MTQRHRGMLTEGSVRRHLIDLTVPMIWSILAFIAVNIADTYFVGHIGFHQLAAISFTFPVAMVLMNVAAGLGAGASAVIARTIGEADASKARRLTTDSLVLSALLSGALSVVAMLTIDPVFRLLGAEDHLLPLIRSYMMISYVGTVFLVVSLVGFSALRAAGDSRTPSLLWVGATILNVILDPLLIFGYAGFPRLEMDGAAVAALITRVFACVIIIVLLHFKNGLLSFSLPGVATILSSWKGILHVGLPATAANMIIPMSAGVITALIASFGPQAVAGFGVATRLEALALVPFFATSSIINPFVGQNAGAGKAARIREAMAISSLFCLAYGVVVAVGLWFGGSMLAAIFTDDPEVVNVAASYLRIVPISYGAAGIVMIANAGFNGLGRPAPAVVISIMRVVVIYVPAAYVGARLFGTGGIFAAACVSNLLVGLGAYLWNHHVLHAPGVDHARDAKPLRQTGGGKSGFRNEL